MPQTFFPVLLGGDLNCYSMARGFFAACGVRSQVFGREALGATRFSRYLSFTAVPELSDAAVCLRVLLDFAKKTPGSTRMLLACTDEYAAFLMRHREELSPFYTLSAPPETALVLADKEKFYQTCDRFGIPHPETVTLSGVPARTELDALGRRLGYPYILKPAESAVYWHYPFAGMEKVYTVNSTTAAEGVLGAVAASGYPGTMLAQKRVGNSDGDGYVLTLYFDRKGNAKLFACAHALLEEHTPRGRGNYAALVTAPLPPLCDALVAMLTAFSYRGFANFDLRRDPLNGEWVALEVNLRQGRSNGFLFAGGENPAAWLLRDLVRGEACPPRILSRQVLFRTVPFSVIERYAEREADVRLAARLHERGAEDCPFDDRYDLFLNPCRRFYVTAHRRREKEKFRTYLTPVR